MIDYFVYFNEAVLSNVTIISLYFSGILIYYISKCLYKEY